jgi:phosphoenolpyruvate carboxylase
MMEIRTIDLPAKDFPLRADVSLLGSLIGQMLVEQHGPGLLEKVEMVRKAAILRRETGDDIAAAGLDEALTRLEPADARHVIQAFAAYLRMVNLAEKVHRIRRRRAYQRAGASAQRGSLDAVIGDLSAAGVGEQALLDGICRLQVQPVFTAHPTEATRRTIQEKEYDIVLRLVERLNPELTPDEEALALQRISAALTSAWQTRLVPHARPAVADELDNILFYLTDILYRVVPVFYDTLNLALARHYADAPLHPDCWPILHFGSWVGGDMDGNPNVSAATIEETLIRQRQVVMQKYLSEVARLGRYLSQTRGEIGVSPAVLQRLQEYSGYLPQVAGSIPERHRDMPYRCLLKWMAARLEATLHQAHGAYASADAFADDIRLVEASLLAHKGEHAGLFGVRRLLLRARTFGFHLATLDVRQDALVHRQAMAQWLGDESWLQKPAAQRTQILADLLLQDRLPDLAGQHDAADEYQRTQAVFRAVAAARRRFGKNAVGLFIISMTQGADDVLTALAFDRACGEGHGGPSALDIAPLLETVDDLAAGPAIIGQLLQQPVYRQHLEARGGRQVVMLGYSDSNKDSGIVAARWALQEAQRQLLQAAAGHGVQIVFFHGRGGTVSRGGGNLVNGILGAPEGSIAGYMRVTEQGEVINQKYGVRPIALRNLELITGAALSHMLMPAGRIAGSGADTTAGQPVGEAGRILQFMARESRASYRALVYGDSRFPAFFRAITPIDVIERLTIGSRPAARRSGEGIGNLRAIPWVFSWAQTRIGFPGVFGVGTALQRAVGEFGIAPLRAMLADGRFFRALIEDVEMVLAKSELDIGRRYAGLVPASHADLFALIEEEFRRAAYWILELKQSAQLLEDQRTLQRNIRLRNPYVDPLHFLQVGLLRRWRDGGSKDEELLGALMATVNGISLGIQNTG